MPEKHNNSNNPAETQPTLEDGTFAYKGGGEESDAMKLFGIKD